MRHNPAKNMKLPLLAAVALSGGGCPSDAFVPKIGALTSTRSLVEPWAVARSTQPRGVSMKSQATPVKVEVSLEAILCPLDGTCKLNLVFSARERHAER